MSNTLRIVFLASLCLCSILAFAAKNDSQEAATVLNKSQAALSSGIVSKEQLHELKKYAKSKDEFLAAQATAILALYQCEVEGDANSALALIYPYILPKDTKSKDIKEALTLPSPSEWSIKYPVCCVTAARILTFQKNYSDALAGYDRVGANLEGYPRVLAGEGVGDLKCDTKNYEIAIKFYKNAISEINDIIRKSSEACDDEKALAVRLSKKLARAELLWDIERYGPGFVAYRTARRAEFGGEHLKAVALYGDIVKDHHDTVYSEAAELYRANCLFQLADPEIAAEAEKRLSKKSEELVVNAKKLKQDGAKMSASLREISEKWQKEEEELVAKMREVPLGKKASESAVAKLKSFIAVNRFGLYRGEALLSLADWTLEKELDFVAAGNYYKETQDWIAEADKQAKALSKWNVPAQAKDVTKPPVAEKVLTGWTQWIEKSPIKPEQIINQNTCTWYMDSLRAHAGKYRSLCCYLQKDTDEALKQSEAVLLYEPLEKQKYDLQQPNSYTRLQKCYKRGWFYAYPDELAILDGKLSTSFAISEFFFAIEEWESCQKIRQAIFNGKFGPLNKNQKASMLYRMADIIICFPDKKKDVLAMLQPFLDGEYKGTLICGEAIWGIGCLAGERVYMKDKLHFRIHCFEEALKELKGKRPNVAEKVTFYLADSYKDLLLMHNEKSAEGKALALYRQILKNPDTVWRDLSNRAIKEIENASNSINNKKEGDK